MNQRTSVSSSAIILCLTIMSMSLICDSRGSLEELDRTIDDVFTVRDEFREFLGSSSFQKKFNEEKRMRISGIIAEIGSVNGFGERESYDRSEDLELAIFDEETIERQQMSRLFLGFQGTFRHFRELFVELLGYNQSGEGKFPGAAVEIAGYWIEFHQIYESLFFNHRSLNLYWMKGSMEERSLDLEKDMNRQLRLGLAGLSECIDRLNKVSTMVLKEGFSGIEYEMETMLCERLLTALEEIREFEENDRFDLQKKTEDLLWESYDLAFRDVVSEIPRFFALVFKMDRDDSTEIWECIWPLFDTYWSRVLGYDSVGFHRGLNPLPVVE